VNGREYVRLGLRILDEQLVDADGHRCGRVEDLEFDAGLGERARLICFLCGATAWKRRLPAAMAELFPGDPKGLRRVPWDQVAKMGNEIELRCRDEELGRASEQERAPLAFSELMSARVVDRHGHALGRVREVIAARRSGDEEEPWELVGVLVGRRALLQRAGFSPLLGEEMRKGRMPPNLIPWERLGGIDDRGRLVLAEVLAVGGRVERWL
jgi:sporulation protein YlmC with PRC-barrel domain